MFSLSEKQITFHTDNLQVQRQCISVLQLCGTTVTVIKHIAKVQPGYGTIIMLTISHVRAVKTELES